MFEIRPYKIVVVHKNDEFHIKCGTYSPDVNSRVPLAEGVPISKLSDDGNRVETGVFSEGRWNNLERVCIRLETVRFHALQRMSIVRQESRNVDLG